MVFIRRGLLAVWALTALFLLSLPVLNAQVTATAPPVDQTYNNRWDFFGGAAYSHFNPGTGHIQATNLVGWNGQATAWFRPEIGLAVSARGYYGKVTLYQNAAAIGSSNISEHAFLFGPDVRLWRTTQWNLGAHAMIGGTYGIFNNGLNGVSAQSVNLYQNQLAFIGAFGASADRNLSPRLAVRLITDFQPSHYGKVTQKEFAGSLGIVYKFGTLH